MKNIAAIYFDLDNTLIDRNKAMDSCMALFFEQYMPNYSYPKEQQKILQKDNWGYTSRADFCQWFIQVYPLLNCTENSFWQYLKTNISQCVPFIHNHIQELLIELHKKYQLGILTNGSIQNQTAKIKQVGLNNIFDKETIHISAQYGLSKPDSKLFQKIIDQVQLPPHQILYVGDDPQKDIWGASQVGMQTCWVSHGRVWKGRRCVPDGVINVLNDIELFLK